jgi:hypothetical protein
MIGAQGILVFVGIVAFIVGCIWLGIYAKKQRRRALAAIAAKLGLQYSRDDPYALDNFPFALFEKGDGRGCNNVLAGSWQGLDVRAFDYWYYDETTSSKGGSSRSYHFFSCVETTLDMVASHVTLTHETLFTRLADHIGFADIQFESEQFNRMFRVKCDDSKFATDLVDARMMQWLLATQGAWSFELLDNSVLLYSNRLAPQKVPLMLVAMQQFLQHVPRVMRQLYPAPGPGGKVGSSEERTTS